MWGGRGCGRLVDRVRRGTPGSIVVVVGHPPTEHDAEGEEDCGNDERAEQQHRRTPLVAPELFKRRMMMRRRRAFIVRSRPAGAFVRVAWHQIKM